MPPLATDKLSLIGVSPGRMLWAPDSIRNGIYHALWLRKTDRSAPVPCCYR